MVDQRKTKKIMKGLIPHPPISDIASMGGEPLVLPNYSGVKKFSDERDLFVQPTDPIIADHPHQDVTTTASPEFDGLDVDDININGNRICAGSGDLVLEADSDDIDFNLNDITNVTAFGMDVKPATASLDLGTVSARWDNAWINTINATTGNFSGDITCDELIITNPTQNWLFTGRAAALAVQGQTAGNSLFEFYKATEEAANRIGFRIYNNAIPDTQTNRERLDCEFDGTTWVLQTSAIGTGTARDIRIGGSSAYLVYEADGDNYWVGSGSGLPFGAFYGNNIGWSSVAFGGGGTFVIINTLTTSANLNLTTFQNNQELLIAKTGKYLVTWTVSGECAGANKHLEFAPGINGTANVEGRNHFETGNANQEYTCAGTAILALTATNTLSLMVTNVDDNTSVEIHHVNLTATQIGG